MPEPLDIPDQSESIDLAIAKLDIDELAMKSNALTGGCLRGIDAMKVLRLVAFSAMSNRGKEVVVAGFRGEYDGVTLSLGYSGELLQIIV